MDKKREKLREMQTRCKKLLLSIRSFRHSVYKEYSVCVFEVSPSQMLSGTQSENTEIDGNSERDSASRKTLQR